MSARGAIVTGSSSGIGKAIAQALLADGWHVTGFDIAPTSIEHDRFTPARVDLCDRTAAEAAAASIGPVAALVHAAGVLRVGPLGKLQAADGELMWRLHVESIASISNVVLPAMAAAREGRVVLIGSRVAEGDDFIFAQLHDADAGLLAVPVGPRVVRDSAPAARAGGAVRGPPLLLRVPRGEHAMSCIEARRQPRPRRRGVREPARPGRWEHA